MARHTSELATKAVGNRFDLVLIAARRVRELNAGYDPTINSKAGNVVKALEEIEQGKIGRELLLKPTDVNPPQRRRR